MKHGDHTALFPVKRGDALDAAELHLPSARKSNLTLLDWAAVKIDLPDVVVAGPPMAAGIKLADHYCGEALRLFEAGHIAPELRLAIRTLEWLSKEWKEPAVSLPDLYQNGPNAIRDAATARQVTKLLEDHGHLVRIKGGARVRDTFRREAWGVVR